ncbi:MAG TPA: copper resistance protein B [Allosphingosinicella sp.]|nr:copper resistance protein B [Allosphingosinicella sp.]
MMRLIVVLLASTAATASFAQHSGHGEPAPVSNPPTAPATTCTPEHAAMGHCTMPAPTPAPAPAATCTPEHAAMGHCTMPASAPAPAPAATCAPEHAAMGHCTMPAPTPAPAPAATCTPEHAAMGHCTLPTPGPAPVPADPHAGHDTPTEPAAPTSADPHAGHQMGDAASAAPPVAPPPPEALSGPAHAQDLFFDPREAARSRAELAEGHGGLSTSRFLVDQLELSMGEGREVYAWDAQFWYGGDIDKFWLTSEGEGEFGGDFEGVELQALWSRAIDPWFDLQAGVRQDLGPGPDRTHLVLGAQGLAPYWFEVGGALFLSTKGEVTARFEGEYDLRLTQRLILQPRLEADFSFQDVPELQLGSGPTSAEVGARLRYEIYPRTGPAVLAPYVGVQYERAFGDTADYRRASGEDSGGWRFLLGIRTWF